MPLPSKETLQSFREFHRFLNRRTHSSPFLHDYIGKVTSDRPEFTDWSVYMTETTQGKYMVGASKTGVDNIMYSPVLDALIVYNNLRQVRLKPCLKALKEHINSPWLTGWLQYPSVPHFLANTSNKNIDKVMLKMFMNEYFNTYYPDSIRR